MIGHHAAALQLAGGEEVAPAQLDRRHADDAGGVVDERLDAEVDLLRAEAAHRRGRQVVGQDAPGEHADVRDLVGAGGLVGEHRDDGRGERGVRAGIGDHVGVERDERAREVCVGQDADHAGDRERGGCIDAAQPAVRDRRPHDAPDERAFGLRVGRVRGGAGELVGEVGARLGRRRWRLAARGGTHGLDDLLVARASAQVARQRGAHGVGLGAAAGGDVARDGRHHAGRAVAALECFARDELIAQPPRGAGVGRILGEPGGGDDRSAVAGRRQAQAARGRRAIDDDGAGAAHALAAAELDLGVAEGRVQHVLQRGQRRYADLCPSAVDHQLDRLAGHGRPPASSSSARRTPAATRRRR
ncbi:MAG TPA: hypothetical protein VGD37_37485 [Kofleriaceae bacterium]